MYIEYFENTNPNYRTKNENKEIFKSINANNWV